jgi:hypothetical protein
MGVPFLRPAKIDSKGIPHNQHGPGAKPLPGPDTAGHRQKSRLDATPVHRGRIRAYPKDFLIVGQEIDAAGKGGKDFSCSPAAGEDSAGRGPQTLCR